MTDTPSQGTGGSGPWSQRGFVVAAAFLAIVILVAVGILLIKPGHSDDSNRGATPATGNDKPATSTDPAASVCGLPPGSQEIPQTPPEANWELVGKIAAPKSRTVGPGVDTAKRRMCFAHSPTGALFAAANFVAVTA